MNMNWIYIFIGGGLGSLSRYALGGVVQKWSHAGFPWGTFVVNLLGCFLFGLIWMITERHIQAATVVKFLFLTGFCGAFTTFSTWTFESIELLRAGEWLAYAGNVGGQIILGSLGLLLGMALGKYL